MRVPPAWRLAGTLYFWLHRAGLDDDDRGKLPRVGVTIHIGVRVAVGLPTWHAREPGGGQQKNGEDQQPCHHPPHSAQSPDLHRPYLVIRPIVSTSSSILWR